MPVPAKALAVAGSAGAGLRGCGRGTPPRVTGRANVSGT